MRVTNRMMVRSGINDVNKRLAALDRSRRQLSSGRRIDQASDDPSGASRAMGLRAQQTARLQEQRNVADAKTMLDLTDSTLQGINDRLRRVRDLAVQGRNAQASTTNRAAMAAEVQQVREELLAVANSRHDGRPLFSGFADVDAVTGGPGTWAYGGDAGVVQRRVGDNDVVATNVLADDVFGFAAGRDTFSVLDDLEAALLADDTNAIGTAIDEVDAATTHVQAGLADVGAARNRVDAAERRNEDGLLAVRSELAQVEDVSIAEVTMELQIQETAYQATLGALARALPPSLATFLS